MIKHWHDSNSPPALRRLQWWFLLPIGGILGVIVLMMVPTFRHHVWVRAVKGPAILPLVLFLPHFIATFIVWRGLRRIRRKVADTNGRTCVHCLYDLRGLPDEGTCPECCQTYTANEIERKWRYADILPPKPATASHEQTASSSRTGS